MNVLNKSFRASVRNKIHLQAQQELENDEEDMNSIIEWYYGRHCSVRTPRSAPIRRLLPGSRVFTNQNLMFVVVENTHNPQLPSVYGDKNQVVEVATRGSGILAGSYLVQTGDNGEVIHKHIVRENQVGDARAKVKENIKQERDFKKLISRKMKAKKKDLAFPKGAQPGDSTGSLWESSCPEHISFRAWRSVRNLKAGLKRAFASWFAS